MKSFLLIVLSILIGCSSQSTKLSDDSNVSNSSKTAYDPLKPPSIPDLASGKEKPPTGEELSGQLSQMGELWLYGPGFGKTILNVGTTVLFPPYGIYLLGNAGLTLAGFDELKITSALPEVPRKHVLMVYDGVASVPGRVAATVSGRDYIESYESSKSNTNMKTLSQ